MTRANSACAMSTYLRVSASRVGERPIRYTRLVIASRGLLISCAMVAAMRPVLASFSVMRSASSDRFRSPISRNDRTTPSTSPPTIYGEAVYSTVIGVPSLRRKIVSWVTSRRLRQESPIGQSAPRQPRFSR